MGSHVGPGSAKTDSFLCPPPTATSGVVAGTGMTQAGSPEVSAPGMVPVSFLPEPDDVKIDEGTLLPGWCSVSGSLVCDLRCVAGLRMICRVSRNVLDSEMHLRRIAGWRLMKSSMSPSPRVRCMCGVVVVREQSRLHGAPHGLRVGVFLRALHAFWGLLRRVQMLFLLRTVLSRLILSRSRPIF